MDAKFTPGPWMCHINDDTDDLLIYGDFTTLEHLPETFGEHGPEGDLFNAVEHGVICAIFMGDILDDEQECNARLISAAPDLHDALEALSQAVWPDKNLKGVEPVFVAPLKRARAALAKARGES